MRRTSIKFLSALTTLTFLAGCGGGSSMTFSKENGDVVGECANDLCEFDWSAPTVHAKSAANDPSDSMVLAPRELERLNSGASSFQVTRDDQPILGLRVLSSGQVVLHGEPAGHVRPDGVLIFD